MNEDKQMELQAHASRGARIDRLRTIRLNDDELSQPDGENENTNKKTIGQPRPAVKSCCP